MSIRGTDQFALSRNGRLFRASFAQLRQYMGQSGTGGPATWGNIGGLLADQADLSDELAGKVPIAAEPILSLTGDEEVYLRLDGQVHVLSLADLALWLGTSGPAPVLTLSGDSVTENATIGTAIGALSVVNGSGVYAYSITADPDSKFAISGAALVTAASINFEAASSHSVTIRADNGVDPPLERTFVIAVANVFEQPALQSLFLSVSEIALGEAVTINILGATAGSVLTVSGLPAGLALNSGARTITGTPTVDGNYPLTITETLADSPNSPRASNVQITVLDEVDETAPTLSAPEASALGANGASMAVTTNEAGGTLFWFISTSATPPTAENLKSGTGAALAGTRPVVLSGEQSFVATTGLTAEATYYVHYLHRDAAGNDSAIASSDAFTTATAAEFDGIAFSFLRGQSNADGTGFDNSTGDLPKNYRSAGAVPTYQMARTSGNAESNAVYGWIDYALSAGVSGESKLNGTGLPGSGVVTSTNFGVVRQTDIGGLFAGASEHRIVKNTQSGQSITAFLPLGNLDIHENRAIRRVLRAWRRDVTAPVYMQYNTWFQGEQDTNPADAAGSTDVESLNLYPERFEAVYAYAEARYGTQPPWFLVEIAEQGAGAVYDEYFNNEVLTQLARYRITINNVGAIVGEIEDLDNGAHPNRYIIRHPFKTSLHPLAAQLRTIGEGIANALRLLHGATGLTTAYPMSQIRPVWLTQPAVNGAPTASSVTFNGVVDCAPTVYAAAVAAGGAAPSVEQIIAGAGGGIVASGSATWPLNASGNVTVSGLAGGTAYDFYFAAVDQSVASARRSVLNVSTAGAADTTAPILSSASGTATGATTATLNVTTDEGNGTLFWYVSTSATPPTSSAMIAGTGAVSSGSQAVTATGVQTAGATALTAETGYYAHFLHRDAALNQSAIATSALFTTGAAGDTTPPVITNSDTGSVPENEVLAFSLTANEAVTWTIVGGADSTQFEISGSTLRWAGNGTQDFENAADSDDDNQYVVTVRATDAAGNFSELTITITVTDVEPEGATPTVWDTSWNATNVIYSDGDRTVTRTDTISTRAVRALSGKSTGKWYALIRPNTANAPQLGIYTSSLTPGGGGIVSPARRAALLSSGQIRTPNGTDELTTTGAGSPTAGSKVHIAVDADAKLFWIKVGSNNWNGSGTANPATGAGGLSIADMAAPYYLAAVMGTTASSGFTILTDADSDWSLPSGFTGWTQ